MTVDDAKAIIAEFDRLGLEMIEGLNLLTDNAIISDNVILFGDIANEDGPRCVEFLKGFNPKPHHPPFHTPETMGQFK